MTFPLFEAFQQEWRRRPPVHWLVSAFMGYEAPAAKPQYMDADAARDFMNRTGGMIEGVGPLGVPRGR